MPTAWAAKQVRPTLQMIGALVVALGVFWGVWRAVVAEASARSSQAVAPLQTALQQHMDRDREDRAANRDDLKAVRSRVETIAEDVAAIKGRMGIK